MTVSFFLLILKLSVIPESFQRRAVNSNKVFAAVIRGWSDSGEVVRVDVAVSRVGDYYPIRDAVMAIPGVVRVEISTTRQRKVYVPAEEGTMLLGGWVEVHE